MAIVGWRGGVGVGVGGRLKSDQKRFSAEVGESNAALREVKSLGCF
jgi:hypothetical protein